MPLTAAQLDKVRDAFEMLEALAEELGDAWDEYEYDGLAKARSALRDQVHHSTSEAGAA
jgi:hypothetical protein